ncbi:major capsid protein [Pseudomonas citronellolis]|uniref:major capsid protein n=1 Tax=Pseudomonas citronellolis TaxID=53408 RepID=UPI00248EF6EF|nr:major capsid protein [Pseudomonas citronellolis]
MEFELYDLATLLQVRRRVDNAPVFWLNFFGRQINFETPYIDFENVNRRYRKLAPFVAPNVQGRVISSQGSRLTRYAPAYVKPKSVIDPNKVIARQPGEVPYQPLSNAQRRDAVIAEETRDHKARLTNRNEWLAANAVIFGSVTISGEDYPTKFVDFGRDPSLTVVLTGAAKWDQATAKPMVDIKGVRRKAADLSGVRIRRVIFGEGAWDLFATRMEFDNPQSGNLLDTTFRGSETSVSRLLDGFEGAEYAGTLTGVNGQGRIECWVYSGSYDDDTGAQVAYMHTYDVVGVGELDGVRCFGAIQDARAGYQALEVFMKNWESPDPSVEYLLSQSAPLMVPGEPNATFRIRVA